MQINIDTRVIMAALSKSDEPIKDQINKILFDHFGITNISKKDEFIERLRENDYNVLKMAEQIGVSKQAIYSKIKKYGINLSEMRSKK